MQNIDDVLIAKLVHAEQDALRDETGQAEGQVPTYTPVAFARSGQVD